jgi:cell division protein FtsI (penicillin-binding protein 3)
VSKNKEESIYLEDYQNEFSYRKKKSNLNIQFNRIAFIFFIFFIIFIIFSIQLLHLGSLQSKKTINISKSLNKNYRADIVDANGNYLVKTVSTIDIGIITKKIIDKKKLLINLQLIFPEKNFAKIKRQIKEKNFFYLEKNISQDKYEKIMLLGDNSIKPSERLTRLYPQKNLFSHIIGQIDDENKGISGIEKSFDQELKKISEPLKLTVDTDIQFLIRKELLKYQEIFRSKGSAAILMNINNGEILSIVSLPDFNLNKRETIRDVNYINRVTKGVYELGSVFKTFTIAAALEAGLIEPETKLLNLKKKLTCGKNTINEYDNKIPSDLTVEEILIKSGNIGSVRIGQMLEIEGLKSFLKKIGILNKINFDIEEVGEPIPFRWGKCKLATASFGHGITTTPLQLAKGYAIISNGGFEITPTLIKNKLKKKKKRIIKENVSKKINLILRKIVEEGTAKLANVRGYEIGGKTGTANKTINGTYSKKYINTFASIFPISNPKFVFVVLMEETQINKDYIYEYRDGSRFKLKGTPRNTAGWTSVEVAGKIIEKIGPILATKYIQN